MSYILDALRKSERERRRGEAQDVRSAPLPEAGEGRKSAWLVPLLAALLVINALVLGGWFLFQVGQPSAPPLPGAAVQETETSPRAVQEEDAIPYFEQLSSARRTRLSPLRLTAHVHAATRPQASFITLNGERLREGQQTKNALRVLRIERAAVLLEHDGTRFRLRVANR